jgi:hypothetical protein
MKILTFLTAMLFAFAFEAKAQNIATADSTQQDTLIARISVDSLALFPFSSQMTALEPKEVLYFDMLGREIPEKDLSPTGLYMVVEKSAKEVKVYRRPIKIQ